MTTRVEHPASAEGQRIELNVPVFEIGEVQEGSGLPPVRITARDEDAEGNCLGRIDVARYPLDEGEGDEGGWDALYYGSQYYNEGMGYTDASDRDTRIECFQAAELLYLHAGERGNPIAWQNLGYVYSYDRCEGAYFEVWAHGAKSFPREERAFECYRKASEAGMPEATYKLGDLHKRGCGCEASLAEAFRCYERAFELGRDDEPVVWGSIALRLGDAYENAIGCEQSFAKALKWYEQAVTGLEIAVNSGEWFYKKALTGARNGVARCKQEAI